MNKLYLAITLALFLVMPMAVAKKPHHIKRFKLVSVKLLPPPPITDIPTVPMPEQLSFKEACAVAALKHTLEICDNEEKAVTEAWAIAEIMERQREGHK